MGLPAILVENVFSQLQFPGHTLVADEQAAGYEVYHLANGRRSPTDRYQSVTANQARTITATGDRVRWCNGLVLDRGHNLAGAVLSVLGSNDAFATSQTVWTGTVPPQVTLSGHLDNTNGVVTEEGAFPVRFPGQAFLSWRLAIPALGAGIVAQIVGAWLGPWVPLPYLVKPVSDDASDLIGLEQQSGAGWLGRTSPVPRRAGTIDVRLTSVWDEETLRLPLDGHYLAAGRPLWYVRDDAQAERAVLCIRPKGLAGFGWEPGWGYLQGKFPYIEHESLRSGG